MPDSLQDIMDSLRWLGWSGTKGRGRRRLRPYFQSERLPLYRHWADWLVENGHAYRCYCTEARLDALRKEQVARARS